jgi:hypothetical protein
MGSRQRQPVLFRPQTTCSQGRRPVRDAEVAGSNPAHPTSSLFRGLVIGYTPHRYVAISAVRRMVSQDRRGQSCAGGAFQGARCPRVAKELGLGAPRPAVVDIPRECVDAGVPQDDGRPGM